MTERSTRMEHSRARDTAGRVGGRVRVERGQIRGDSIGRVGWGGLVRGGWVRVGCGVG